VSAGTLVVNGTNSGAGTVSVAVGATLGGSGTIGGATTISGIHSPGTSPGVQTFTNGLTYNNGSAVVWDLIGNGVGTRGVDYDGVDVTGGTLDFAGTTTMNLTFNLTNSVELICLIANSRLVTFTFLSNCVNDNWIGILFCLLESFLHGVHVVTVYWTNVLQIKIWEDSLRCEGSK
jgi:hypothetical protein